MFFKAQLVKDFVLEPRFMGKQIREMVHQRLKEAVEGKLEPNVGYIVTVLRIGDEWMGKGRIDNMTGGVIYNITYEALVFRPFKNEVVDVIVTEVSNLGYNGTIGGLVNVFVSRSRMQMELEDDPSEFEDGAWVSRDRTTAIRKDCHIRLRLVTVRFYPDSIFAIGDTKGDFCGLLVAV